MAKIFSLFTLAISIMAANPCLAGASRIRDLVTIRGVRTNTVSGIGLIIGLSGSGDSKKSLATSNAAANMLTRMGIKTDSADVVAGNMAVVVVTGELKPFSRNGEVFDVRVSTVGDAKSLTGGTLLLTPLRAGNGDVYAVAQGTVVTAQGATNGNQIASVGTVPSGGTVEREISAKFASGGSIVLVLREPDFTTNVRIADAINTKFRGFFAVSSDPGAIQVMVPPDYTDREMEFTAEVEQLKVDADHKSVVIVNERTGTVVMGSDVAVEPVTISHGSLTITVKEGKKTEEKSIVRVSEPSVRTLVDTLNALGVRPQDLAAIIQSMHAAGAIHAELKFL
jgi:flagellar P-ring protein FlgI